MSEPLIVVPLDGAELSESSLPYACAIGKATDSRLLLVAVFDEIEARFTDSLQDTAEDLSRHGEQHLEHYLAGVAERLTKARFAVETDVRIGDPAEEILHVVEQHEPRMLVMATHGRSGFCRAWYGSVASKLARLAPVPTTLVGPKVLANMVTGTKAVKNSAEAFTIRRILVPLDASPLAESALQPARELAESLGAELVLVQVVRWATSVSTFGVPDIDIVEIDRQLTEAAEQYLARVTEQMDTRQPVETRVLHGPPADSLIDLTEAQHIDLVVMTSHARSTMASALIGSVADRMLRGQAPVTLIRPEGVTAIRRAPRGRYCHSCGRASPFIEVLPADRCLRCGQHLRACANCVYHDGIACLLQRPEMHDAYPGQDCQHFQFRETAAPEQTAHNIRTEAATRN